MDPFLISPYLFTWLIPKSQGKQRIISLNFPQGQLVNSSQSESTAATNHFFRPTLKVPIHRHSAMGNISKGFRNNSQGHLWSMQVISPLNKQLQFSLKKDLEKISKFSKKSTFSNFHKLDVFLQISTSLSKSCMTTPYHSQLQSMILSLKVFKNPQKSTQNHISCPRTSPIYPTKPKVPGKIEN